MAPWFPEMMTPPPPALQLPELLSITPPRCDHHQTSGTENPSHQPSEMLDLLCCCWTPWWQEQKLSCHLQHFTALSGTMPSVLHPLHGVFVAVTDPCGGACSWGRRCCSATGVTSRCQRGGDHGGALPLPHSSSQGSGTPGTCQWRGWSPRWDELRVWGPWWH